RILPIAAAILFPCTTLFRSHEIFPGRPARATVLDLGCGAADVVIRFAEANPRYTFHAVDGSAAMLKYARMALQGRPNLIRRIRLDRKSTRLKLQSLRQLVCR